MKPPPDLNRAVTAILLVRALKSSVDAIVDVAAASAPLTRGTAVLEALHALDALTESIAEGRHRLRGIEAGVDTCR